MWKQAKLSKIPNVATLFRVEHAWSSHDKQSSPLNMNENSFSILDSTPRSQKINKISAKCFQSFISPRVAAGAPIGFLLLKALYLSFQMHTSYVASSRRAFQISVELITEASLKKNFYMRFQWWQTVLLEWDSNLANSCSVIEKKRIS